MGQVDQRREIGRRPGAPLQAVGERVVRGGRAALDGESLALEHVEARVAPAAPQEVVVDRLDEHPPARRLAVHGREAPPGQRRHAPGGPHHVVGRHVQGVLVDDERPTGLRERRPKTSRTGRAGSRVRT